MLCDFSKPIGPALRRRLIVGVTLLAYWASTIGYPLPEALARAAHACGQQVCGCGTPATCNSGGCGCSHAPPPAPVEEETPSCCKKKSACCAKKDGKTPSCCAKKPGDAKKQQAKKAKPITWVVGVAAQKCRGGATHWLSGDVALPGPMPMTWTPCSASCGIIPFLHTHPFVVAGESLDPPPRPVAV